MTQFVYFLGRFHVLVLHLPIGIILAAVLTECLACVPKYRHLRNAAVYLWGVAAVSAVVTAVLGYLHATEGTFEGAALSSHRMYGTAVAAGAALMWACRARWASSPPKIFVPAGLVLTGLVAVAGHYGGNLTHGSTYLVEYAPNFVRRLAGLADSRPSVHDVLVADPYFDIVEPMLKGRCSTCHNDSKRSGGLSVASYGSLIAGGETGPVIARGNPEASELHRRIALPKDDDEFMPAEGKTPLTEPQVAIIAWWINAGAPSGTTVAALSPDPVMQAALRVEVGLESGDSIPAAGPDESATATAPEQLARLVRAGFVVREISKTDPRLIVIANFRGGQAPVEALAALQVVASSVAELNLQRSSIDDSLLENFGEFTQLTSLRLSNNHVSDSGVAKLVDCPSLVLLNLYGNEAVTDAAIESIASMKRLQMVYLWGTSITDEGVRSLRARRPDLTIEAGMTPHSASSSEETK